MADTVSASAEPTVTLTGDAAPFVQALDRAAAAMQAWGARVDAQMQQASATTQRNTEKMGQTIKQRFDELRGKADKIGGMVGVNLAASFAALAQKGAAAFEDMALGAKKLEREIDRLAEANAELDRSMDKLSSRRKEWIDAAASPTDRIAAIDKEIKLLLKKKEIEDADRKDAEAAGKKLSFGIETGLEDSTKTLFTWVGGNLERSERLIEERIKAAKGRSDKFFAEIKELEDAKARAKNPDNNPEMVKSVNDMTAALKRQADTWGMTADAVALYDLKLKGASEKQIKAVEDAQKNKDLMIAMKAVTGAAAGFFGLKGGPEAPKADFGKGVDALVGGSAGAQSAITAARRSTQAAAMNDPQVRAAAGIADLVKAAAENAANDKEAIRKAEETRKAIDRLREVMEANI